MENKITLPQQYAENMQKLLKSDYEKYVCALNQPPIHGVRLNTVKCTDEQILDVFGAHEKVPFCSNGYILPNSKIGKHPYHIAGLVYVQEPSSMLAVCASGLAEEQDKNLLVLDLCAAPGGKSGQIAEILNGNGVLVSNEIEPKRARILQSNIERMDYKNVIVTSASAEKLSDKLAGQFDYIFVDAPCGGEGMFRKDPDTILEWKAERLESNAARQRDILEQADKMLKSNGKLIYSTCTFSPTENEEVVLWFSNRFGYTLQMPNETIKNNTTSLTIEECRRFYPFISKGEGQFVCVMKKPDGATQSCRKQKIEKLGNNELKLLNKFVLDTFHFDFAPRYTKIGENYCIIDEKLQNMLANMQKLPIICAGIVAGTIEKARFIPHHNLTALASFARQKINFLLTDKELQSFLHGEQLENKYNLKNGHAFVCVDGFAVGMVRVTGNALKNCFPKGLRI